MVKPFANGLRWKMVEMVRNGPSRRQTADRFQVSVSCVVKLMQRVEATGDLAPARFDGFESSPLATREADIRSWVTDGALGHHPCRVASEARGRRHDFEPGRDRAVSATARPDAKKSPRSPLNALATTSLKRGASGSSGRPT